MFFSGGLIPSYILVQNLGLYNTRWALDHPGRPIDVWNLIIMRTSFQGIPDSLEESAGLKEQTILSIPASKSSLPLSVPGLAVIALYYSVAPLELLVQRHDLPARTGAYPLQLVLREILNRKQHKRYRQRQRAIAETIKYAAIIVSTIPILKFTRFCSGFCKGRHDRRD
jgi:putative aldouronate transport system permease protein